HRWAGKVALPARSCCAGLPRSLAWRAPTAARFRSSRPSDVCVRDLGSSVAELLRDLPSRSQVDVARWARATEDRCGPPRDLRVSLAPVCGAQIMKLPDTVRLEDFPRAANVAADHA